jgi:hypothetical protein
VLGIVGPPYSTAGCEVTGDLDALMKGRRAVIRETARITITGVPVPPAPAGASCARPPAYRGNRGRLCERWPAAAAPPPGPPRHRVTAGQDLRPQAGQAIISRLRPCSRPDSHPSLARTPELPIEDITDQADAGTDVRIVIALRPGSDPVAVRGQLAAIDDITTEATWKFPAPLASMLRSWVDRYRSEDIAAGLASLEDAISGDRRREQSHR